MDTFSHVDQTRSGHIPGFDSVILNFLPSSSWYTYLAQGKKKKKKKMNESSDWKVHACQRKKMWPIYFPPLKLRLLTVPLLVPSVHHVLGLEESVTSKPFKATGYQQVVKLCAHYCTLPAALLTEIWKNSCSFDLLSTPFSNFQSINGPYSGDSNLNDLTHKEVLP